MKRQIRRGVFETNSSSVHSLQIMSVDDYDRWNNDNNSFLYIGSGWSFEEHHKPENNKIYTKEEVIEFIRHCKYVDMDSITEEDELDTFHEEGFYESEYWWDYYGEEFETYEEIFSTPSNDKMVAFGYYGHD